MASAFVYELQSARIIRVGIADANSFTLTSDAVKNSKLERVVEPTTEVKEDIETESNSNTVLTQFQNIFNENILSSSNVSIHKKITLDVSELNKDVSVQSYNFVFYLMPFSDIMEKNDSIHKKNIRQICSHFSEVRNHLFVIMTECDEMELDDDGDLIFSEREQNVALKNFTKTIKEDTNSNLFDMFQLSMPMAQILLKIIEDKSIVNLTDSEIDLMAGKYIRKSSKMSVSDKKREIKAFLKKKDIDDKLSETGYNEMLGTITKHLKLVTQKKIVCRNYLASMDKIQIQMVIGPPAPNHIDTIQNLQNILTEIFEISFLKEDMFDNLIGSVQAVLKTKIESFCNKTRDSVAIESGLLSSVDAYKYYDFLSQILEIEPIKNEKLPDIVKIITKETDIVNKMIINHYNKEVGKIIDLDKISAAFKAFALKDKKNVLGLFEKMRSNPQIITENITHTDKWIAFIDTCTKLEINQNAIVNLVEHVIYEKIKQSVDMTRSTKVDLYPYCLLTFLTKNLATNFIFEKIYMMLSCNIRYSGRNIPDAIQGLDQEKYMSILLLEHKLLDLVKSQS